MSSKNHLKQMSDDINESLKKTSVQDITWKQLNDICKIVSKSTSKISLNKNIKVPFGRYLVFKNSNFNIQLDIFSQDYVGAPHNHETWGVMCGISGHLGITDYIKRNEHLEIIRKGILNSGSTMAFTKENDWHSTETFSGDQVASFHVYGPNFDLDFGYRFDKKKGIEKYQRGKLNHYTTSSNILVIGD